jgi:hypothetical protein
MKITISAIFLAIFFINVQSYAAQSPLGALLANSNGVKVTEILGFESPSRLTKERVSLFSFPDLLNFLFLDSRSHTDGITISTLNPQISVKCQPPEVLIEYTQFKYSCSLQVDTYSKTIPSEIKEAQPIDSIALIFSILETKQPNGSFDKILENNLVKVKKIN